MNEPQELEKTATAYVANAVESEKQGETGKAISLYQKAIECLNQLVERYPKYGFSKLYRDRANVYQERVTALQTAMASKVESNEPPAKPQELDPPKNPSPEPSVDLVPILSEINKKLDVLTTSVVQLKDEVENLKTNMNNVAGKSELSQKEVTEIRNLLYSIKYER
jgi:tetratricopeptide (TPR) repeat protein